MTGVATRSRATYTPEPDEMTLWSWVPLVTLMKRKDAFSQITRLSEDEILLSRFCATPLPIYPEEWPEGRRRWRSLRPEAMWHPLLWLPDELSGRYAVVDDSAIEDDDTWALRVALEVEARGLYDTETGQWKDILAMHGLDIDDPDVVRRVAAWLDGASDPQLDSITLPDPVIPPEVAEFEDWAILTARAMMPTLSHEYLISDAEDHHGAIVEVRDGLIAGDPEIVASAAMAIIGIACSTYTTLLPYSFTESGWWHRFAEWARDSFRHLTNAKVGSAEAEELVRLVAGKEVSEALERLSDIISIGRPELSEVV